MENIFKFRKSMSIHILGIFFNILLILQFVDFSTIEKKTISTFNILKDLGSLFNSIILILLIFVLGTLGIAFLNFVVNIFKIIFNQLASFIWVYNIIIKFKSLEAFLPINFFIKDYYQKNKAHILHFIYYRSCTKTENIGMNEEIETLILTQIGKYYARNLDAEIIKDFNYHSSLTQEQVKLENNQINVYALYYSIINAYTLVTLLVVINDFSFLFDIILYISATLLLFILSFQIYDNKKFMASAIIYGFFDNFTVSELADIADREAF